LRLSQLGQCLGQRDQRLLLAVLLAALLLALGGWLLNGRVSTHLLQADAASTAHRWAESLTRQLGDELPALLAGQAPSPAARTALAQAEAVGQVFRYKLFDRTGRLTFVSDGPAIAGPSDLAPHRADAHAAAAILAGTILVRSRHGQAPGQPAFYSEAYVPVRRDGALTWVAEVYVDQTWREALYQHGSLVAQLGSMAVVLLAAGLPAWIAWRRTHEQRLA
jgi:hypothetical protein